MITFFLNGQYHQVTDLNPNTTVLDFLRLHQGMTDTKEGCASGDCGACTVMAQALPNIHIKNDATQNERQNEQQEADIERPFFTVNACITLLSLLDGHHLMTASYLADNPFNHPKKAQLHPAQQAMVECHGSQCGFCTPGFVMSLASVYENHACKNNINKNHDDKNQLSRDEVVTSISGNLCRCTGYRPIIEAGLRMQQIGQDNSQNTAPSLQQRLANAVQSVQMADMSKQASLQAQSYQDGDNDRGDICPVLSQSGHHLFMPQSLAELEWLLQRYPEATLWAGGTDLGLSITQHLIEHQVIIQLSKLAELKQYSLTQIDKEDADTQQMLVVGAGMTYQQLLPVLQQYIPEFAKLLPRIASPQIRNMGTIGGNIANASPIGDMPPVLLALDAKIHLRHCATEEGAITTEVEDEIIALSQFFLEYKKTRLRAGSYIVAIHIPIPTEHQYLFIHKISKRYEDDISACLLAMRIDIDKEGHRIVDARIGLGGMAAIPTLARQCQQALIDTPIHQDSFIQAASLIGEDVTPMTDVRASRHYRLHVVKGLLLKCGLQLQQMMNSQEVVR
ncbi:xanthine dehydrogenase small subunit [Psychrobacter sp. I-STPA6b]|uniref:xanthine dehydrogenase small subunit n=1 Tax=Psychrobacter sp. I-STPA6b TaxID=2585718 RepID=UPI001D0C5831|nr:FAD binding domain-containing protein [Psychrobacter sp. I-STPA6b]